MVQCFVLLPGYDAIFLLLPGDGAIFCITTWGSCNVLDYYLAMVQCFALLPGDGALFCITTCE